MTDLSRRPRVEVIIACHSADRPLGTALGSVLEGSSGLASVTVVAHNISANQLCEGVPEPYREQVKWVELFDGIHSPAGPFALGLDQAEAEWVSLMGSDDSLEPGAIRTWLSLSPQADAVIARVRHDSAAPVRTPVVRPLPRRRRDPVRDRLYYRSAPLGLLRSDFLKEQRIRLQPGVPSGEDLPFSTALWTKGRVRVQTSGPAYVVGSGASDRVTMSLPPLHLELAHVDTVWNPDWLSSLTGAQVSALGTKYLRVHLFGAAFNRSDLSEWAEGDRRVLSESAQKILQAAPKAAAPLALADRRLLDAILDLSCPDLVVNDLAKQRRQFGRPATLIPRQLTYLFHREAPPRFMTASALVR